MQSPSKCTTISGWESIYKERVGREEVNKGWPVDNLKGIYGDNRGHDRRDEAISVCTYRYHKVGHQTKKD